MSECAHVPVAVAATVYAYEGPEDDPRRDLRVEDMTVSGLRDCVLRSLAGIPDETPVRIRAGLEIDYFKVVGT